MLWLSHERPGGAVQDILRNGLIDGIVVSIVAQEDPWVTPLLDGLLPCALVGRHATRDVSHATIDNVNGTRALMRHLRDEGYTRLATIRGPLGNADADERFAVFVEERGGPEPLDANLIAVGDYTYDTGFAAATALLRHQPDCIVASNDHMALGAIDALAAAGLSVPGDVGVCGWDDMRALNRPDVGLTTVRQDVDAVGREAVAILLELLGGAEGPIRRVLPAPLVVRNSTRRSARVVGGQMRT